MPSLFAWQCLRQRNKRDIFFILDLLLRTWIGELSLFWGPLSSIHPELTDDLSWYCSFTHWLIHSSYLKEKRRVRRFSSLSLVFLLITRLGWQSVWLHTLHVFIQHELGLLLDWGHIIIMMCLCCFISNWMHNLCSRYIENDCTSIETIPTIISDKFITNPRVVESLYHY